MKLGKIITFVLAIGIVFSSESQNNTLNNQVTMRNIDIAGVVIDSKTLLSIEDATIYDENDNILASTNQNGYFKAKLNYSKDGEIEFKLKIEKEEYFYFVQQEHWGNLEVKINAIYYFGLQNKHSNSKAFSKLISIDGDLSYKAINENFRDIKERVNFKNKVTIAKEGNEDVFFKIDNNFYIINNTGWIKIYSKDDLISINGKKDIPATEINSLIKRKDVKGMTPTDSKKVPFAIYMK